MPSWPFLPPPPQVPSPACLCGTICGSQTQREWGKMPEAARHVQRQCRSARMFQRILIPLDGSQRAERAVLVAGCVAQVTSGSLLLLQVLSAPAELLPFVAPALEPSTLSADESAAMNYLKSVAQLAPDVQSELVVRTGLAANMIANVADTEHVDAIFLTSDGPWPVPAAAWCIPERVSLTSPAPVLVQRGVIPSPVGPAAPAGGPEQPSYLRVLVPVDGSPEGEAALEPAAILAGALSSPGARLAAGGSDSHPEGERARANREPRHISRARSSDCARRRSTRSTSPPTGPSPRVRIRLRRWRGSPATRPTPARARSTSSPSRLHQRSAPNAGPSTM